MLKVVLAAGAVATAAVVTTLPLAAAPTASAQAEQSGAFAVDTVHSALNFSLGYSQGVSEFAGRFNQFSGSFNMNSDNPSASVLEITVNAASIDTNNDDRDAHLRNPDFFNTALHKNITFVGESFEKTGENTFNVTGELTMLGETKTITAKVTKLGEGEGRRGGQVQGIKSVFTITRSEFGMNYGVDNGALGDEVTITLRAFGRSSN